MHLFKLCFLLLFTTSISIFPSQSLCQNKQPVFSRLGNIYYTEPNGHTIQITHSGKDSSPVLSSNKQIIAFVRIGNQPMPEECDADLETKYGNQIWIYDLTLHKERLLVANNFACEEPKKQILNPSNLLFSPDDKILYFMTSAWTTSGAVHGVKIDSTQQRFIVDANEMEVVPKGEYKGYLIVNKHRYFVGGGSYDWYWLVSPEGIEEGPLGPEVTKEQMDYMESNIK